MAVSGRSMSTAMKWQVHLERQVDVHSSG